MWIFPLIQIYTEKQSPLNAPSQQLDCGGVDRGAYLCRWGLQGVVVQDNVLQLRESSVTDGNEGHFVTGEIQMHQRQLSQLCTSTETQQ